MDTQETFNLTIGDSTVILPNDLTSTKSESFYSMIQEYCKLYKLSNFMHLCQLNYVGNDTVDVGLNTLEVCNQISDLRQGQCANGCVTHDTPEKIFDKFSRLVDSLPDNSSTWYVQLCSCFLAALSNYLVNHVTSKPKFRIPGLTELTSKAL